MSSTQSNSISSISSNFWISKQSAYKLWQNINAFVTEYVAEHQDQLETPWLTTWHRYYEVLKIGDKNRDFQTAAYIITGNPDDTVFKCFEAICTLIPPVRSYFTVLDQSSNGNIRCSIQPFGFTTPKVV